MNRNAIRIVLLLGILSITGIISVQFYFIRKAFNQEDRQLDQSITIALGEVATQMARYNRVELPRENPVYRYSSNYYIVNVNSDIDPRILEQFLITEFTNRNIKLDFEYGIYDCRSDKMVTGRLVRFRDNTRIKPLGEELPKHSSLLYYFGVHFPGRTQFLMNSMNIWFFFTLILLVVIVFFGYSQWIILRQRRYTEIQRDFINTMTHEFKTPLASLKMSADVVQRKDITTEPERLATYGKIIGDQVNHLLKQVENVLESSGSAGNQFILKKENIDLKVLIKEIIDLLAARISASGGIIKYDFDDHDFTVEGDRLHLTNVLLNLLDNSLKYTDKNPEITIGLKVQVKKRILMVQDRGIGIPGNYSRRVFDRFYRVPTGNVHDVKGFGLGLYYVRKVVRAHGWKISLESKEKEGTLIRIIIPGK